MWADDEKMPGLCAEEAEALKQLLAATRDGRLQGSAMPETGWPAASGITAHQPGDTYEAVLCVLCDDDHPLLLLDNLIADCRDCGRRVQYRPASPPGPYLCVQCAAAALRMMQPPQAPDYWPHETTGVLRPAVEAYLAGGALSTAQIAALRAYLRQWIMAPVWDRNPFADDGDRAALAELRGLVDKLTTRRAIERWLAYAVDEGFDPL